MWNEFHYRFFTLFERPVKLSNYDYERSNKIVVKNHWSTSFKLKKKEEKKETKTKDSNGFSNCSLFIVYCGWIGKSDSFRFKWKLNEWISTNYQPVDIKTNKQKTVFWTSIFFSLRFSISMCIVLFRTYVGSYIPYGCVNTIFIVI